MVVTAAIKTMTTRSSSCVTRRVMTLLALIVVPVAMLVSQLGSRHDTNDTPGRTSIEGIVVISLPVDDDDDDDDDYDEPHNHPNTCGLYLAESSIPKAGLGVYTAKEWMVNSTTCMIIPPTANVQNMAICILDLDFHNDYSHYGTRNKNDNNSNNNSMAMRNMLQDYAWSTAQMGPHHPWNNEAQSVSTILPGLGALANGHFGLHNIMANKDGFWFPNNDDKGDNDDFHDMRRRTNNNPGVGAMSRYHDVQYRTTKHVAAGSELFLDYGIPWFQARETQMGIVTPFEPHYAKADQIVTHFHNYYILMMKQQNLHSRGKDVKEQHSLFFMDLWSAIRDMESSTEDKLFHLSIRHPTTMHDASQRDDMTNNDEDELLDLLNRCKFKSPRTRAALPEDLDGVTRAVEVGTARCSVPNSIRSVEWLKENGA
eukprot:scaffold82168_cov49-Attheya_sp.AAC.3